MKKIIVLLFLLCSLALWANEKSQVTVKSAEKSNDVVIVTVLEDGKSLESQCNES